MAFDAYVEVRGNPYSVPHRLCGQTVACRITLEGRLTVFDANDRVVAEHRLKSARDGWVTVPAHHARLWDETLKVERRDLAVYAEVASWN